MKVCKRTKIDGLILSVLLFFPAFNYYFAEVLYSFGIKNPIVQVIYFFIYLCGAYAYFRNITHSVKYVALVLVIFVFSIVITPSMFDFIIGPVFFQSLFSLFFLVYFPIFLITSEKSFDFDIVFKRMYPYALVVDIFCIITYGVEVVTLSMLHEYMTFAYTGLPAILLSLYLSYSKKHVLGMFISTIASFTIIFGGCRGALLTLAVFVVFLILHSMKSSNMRLTIMFLVLIVSLNADAIFSSVNDVLGSFGYESRIMTLVENEEVIESSGRNAVFEKAISLISLGGHGVYSDRVLLEHVESATYCHNWILEFLVDYGIILGSILVFCILFKIIHFIRIRDSLNTSGLFMLYFTISMLFVSFMLSGSYLVSEEFSLILAWFVNSKSTILNNIVYAEEKK